MYCPSVSITYPTAPKFNTAYHSNDTMALKAVSRELGLFEDKSFIVVISSSKDQSCFDRLVPKLAKFPVLCMSQAKGPHTHDIFLWHSHLAQKMLNRYLSLGLWLDRMIDLAEYYDVPVGHIEGDQPLMLSDISFARRLVQQDIVLWWSPGDQPDLGGIEHDRRPTEDLPKTDFLSAGVYPNVCLEITVRNLAVNSNCSPSWSTNSRSRAAEGRLSLIRYLTRWTSTLVTGIRIGVNFFVSFPYQYTLIPPRFLDVKLK